MAPHCHNYPGGGTAQPGKTRERDREQGYRTGFCWDSGIPGWVGWEGAQIPSHPIPHPTGRDNSRYPRVLQPGQGWELGMGIRDGNRGSELGMGIGDGNWGWESGMEIGDGNDSSLFPNEFPVFYPSWVWDCHQCPHSPVGTGSLLPDPGGPRSFGFIPG